MAGPVSQEKSEQRRKAIPGTNGGEKGRTATNDVPQPAGNQAAFAINEKERKRWNEAMGWGQGFDRLSPEERAKRSISLRERASLDAIVNKSPEEDSSTMKTIQEGAATFFSWLTLHGEANAILDVVPTEVGEKLAEAAGTRTKSFRQIADELDAADSPDRVAFAFMESPYISMWWLDLMASSSDGKYLLNRLYARLLEGTTGSFKGFIRGMIPVPLVDERVN